jgi:hypothetical protein
MISSVSAVLASFASTLRSRLDLVFEHLALLHQVMVMRRSRRRAQFSGADRCFWILLSTLWDRWPKSLNIAKPATVLRWRREGLWKVWRKGKAKRRPGRSPLDAQLVGLIGQMSRSNFLWSAPRIHGELLKLGLKVSQATVAKYMVPLGLRRGPSWRVFLRNEWAGLRDNGLTVELKEAWDELRALWPWSQGLNYGSEAIPAFYGQYVDGLKIEGLEVEWADGLPSFFTSGIQCENLHDVDIDGFSGGPAHADGGKAAIALSKGKGVSIRNSEAGKGTGVFLSHSEVEGGLFVNNDLGEAQKVCDPAKLPSQASENRLPKKPGDKQQ